MLENCAKTTPFLKNNINNLADIQPDTNTQGRTTQRGGGADFSRGMRERVAKKEKNVKKLDYRDLKRQSQLVNSHLYLGCPIFTLTEREDAKEEGQIS